MSTLDEKVPCVECGKPVSVKLASKRNGLCLRCSANRNPFFVLYSSLIDRVCHAPEGFESLSEAAKLYYALTLFRNEINNGGFHQFFFNSSGSYYDLIENVLGHSTTRRLGNSCIGQKRSSLPRCRFRLTWKSDVSGCVSARPATWTNSISASIPCLTL